MTNLIRNKLTVLLMLSVFSANVFGQALSCHQIADKQLCDKIGQMLIIGFGGFKQDDNGKVLWDDKDSAQFSKASLIARHIADKHVGGIILFLKPIHDIKTKEFIRDRNVQSPAQVSKLNKALQKHNNQTRKEQDLESLPLFVGVDQEGGSIDRLPASRGFPVTTIAPQALGEKEVKFMPPRWASHLGVASRMYDFLFSLESKRQSAINETYLYAKTMAQELNDLSFNLNFAPTVDVNINPANPIIGERGRSFSSNPEIVVDQVKQFITAFAEYNIIPALKHFPGHGSSSGDSHVGLVDVTNTYQKEKELQPYRRLIAEGYDGMVMTTHVINGQIDKAQCRVGLKSDHTTWCPGTMSKKALTGLLRNQMGFKGIVVSDDMTMGAITEEYSLRDALKNGINAGVDIFIVANNYEDQTQEVINTIAQLVESGDVEREKIDAPYERIVKYKRKYL